jgi:hypothetical protein
VGTLFDDEVPLMQRVKFLSGNTVAVEIALDWDSTSLIGTAASWFTLTPPMQTITMDTLYELGAIFNEPVEQLSVQVKCPVLHSTLFFSEALQSSAHEGWTRRLVETTVCNRLDRHVPTDPPFDAAEIPNNAGWMLKPTMTYLSFSRGPQLAWLQTWKQQRADDKAARAVARTTEEAERRTETTPKPLPSPLREAAARRPLL